MVLIFLTLTQECNLHCTYCGGGDQYDDIEDPSYLEHLHPKNIKYDFDLIKNLKKIDLKDDKEGLIVCFYGGEPLMTPQLIEKAFEILPEKTTFVLQTNGTLLKRFPHINKMSDILVSIDGDSEITDLCRGEGTWSQSIAGCLHARKNGYKGDLIARMTVHKESDIYEDVTFLLFYQNDLTGEFLFDHVHWQLDVLWDSPGLYRWEGDFEKWRDENYNPGIRKLGQLFVEYIKKDEKKGGRILGIAPILGILYTYLTNQKRVTLRCGSGISSFNVTTGGFITNCPVAPEMEKVMSLEEEEKIPKIREVGGRIGGYCEDCEVLDECGGRCLHANKKCFEEKDKENFDKVCVCVKFILDVVKKEVLPEVKELIEKGKYKVEDFHYPKYNNSIEVMP